MIKRFLALALCFVVVVVCNIVSFAVNAEEERPTVYMLSIISNEMNDDCINGYMYGDETFISIDDVCTLTRSTFDIDKSNVNLYHGVMEVQIDTSENKITFWNQSTDFETKRYKDKILVKPYAILELLCARCSYIDDDKVLCVLMPSITIYEALDFDLYNKCYYNIYKGDEFNTIVRATSALFSDVAFDGVGNFFNMLVESFSFNGSDRYIDRALIEISDVKINGFASVENQMSQTLENRNKAVECVEKASGYSEGVGSLASAYVDILEKTIGNSDSSINIATKTLSKTANIVDYLSLIKSAEEKLDYDLDSFELIGKVMTEDNIGSIEGTDYIIERADYISETLESRLAQYFETTEQKVREKAFEKIIKDSAEILDKGSKYPIGEISAFILSCEIGTTVTKLLMNDKFEAWDADMNAIMLSEIQNTMYDVIRNKYTNCFANYDNAIEFVDALNLYNRTSIAMYSNLKKADEEFNIYVESFTGKFSGECDRMCEKLALNTYNLHSCNLEEDICSLENFKKYYDNDITKNVDITEPEEQLPAIDLINKTIPEIIDIMGGEYQVIKTENDGYVYIQNQSVLPGMEFYVAVPYYDYDTSVNVQNGEKLHDDNLRSLLKSGEYQLDGIQVNSTGQVDTNINASMNYNECAKLLGEFECTAGSGGYLGGSVEAGAYTYTSNNVDITLYFDVGSDLVNALSMGEIRSISSEQMKSLNPSLMNVVIHRNMETGDKEEIKLSDYTGKYQTTVNNAILSLTVSDSGESVHFNVFEETGDYRCSMSGSLSNGNTISYSDGLCRMSSPDGVGNGATLYMDGTGYFKLNSNGTITWYSDNDDDLYGCVFSPVEDDINDEAEVIIETATLTDNDIKPEWTHVKSLNLDYPVFITNDSELQAFLDESVTNEILGYMETDSDYDVHINGSFDCCDSINGYISIFGNTGTLEDTSTNHWYTYFIDYKNRRIMSLYDLFEESSEEISLEISNKVDKYVPNTVKAGPFYQDIIFGFNYKECKFALDKNNLTVIYSPYIAGSLEVQIPLSDINLTCVIPEINTMK